MSTAPDPLESARDLIRDGDPFAAIEQYEQALQLHGTHQVRVELAFLLWQCYEFGRASELFQNLANDPDTDIGTLLSIAKNLFVGSRFAESARVMQQVLQRPDGETAPHLIQLASCLERDNQLDQAAEICERAMGLDPSNHLAIRQRAHIDRRNGELEMAVQRMEVFLASMGQPPAWELRYELAYCLDRIGRYEDAWTQLVTAKTHLAPSTTADLRRSYAVRQRQGELSQKITGHDLRRWSRNRIQPTQRIALMAGFPRSGTTLLEQILAGHRDVVATDETGILTQQFISPMIWQAEDSFAALVELRGLEADQIVAGREAYMKFTQSAISETIGSRLLIEKDPLLTCDLWLPLRLFPEAKLVMPLRDPRDAVLSYFFTMAPFGWSSAPAIDIVEAARFYHDVMRHWLLVKQRLPWPTHEVRYESLVHEQETTTQTLCDFLELDFQPAMLTERQRSNHRSISTPTYDDVAQPIYRRSLERWRNYEHFLEPAMPILDPFVKELGYA